MWSIKINYPAGRRGIDGAEADGGRRGTWGGGLAPPAGRDGTIGAALFIADIACCGVMPICFMPELRVEAAWYICWAFLIWINQAIQMEHVKL